MMGSIDGELNRFMVAATKSIFLAFSEHVQRDGRLCVAKSVCFEGGSRPDYADKMQQLFYLLRYFPAYLTEYYYVFSNIPFCHAPMRVVSVGCGCGLDYYALHYVLRAKGIDPAFLHYVGYDIEKWLFADLIPSPNCAIKIESILDVADVSKVNGGDVDLIVFPKSISDISDFQKLLDVFKGGSFDQKEIMLVSFAREQEHNLATDIERFSGIVDALREVHGFVTEDNPRVFYQVKKDGKGPGLRNLVSAFKYDDGVYSYMEKLNAICPTFIKNGKYCKDDCEQSLSSRRPILKSNYMRFQKACLRKVP